jgi:iron complex outermembrane receptor protein
MFYQDQLINTGAINSTGAPIRINVGQSYRVGAEWSGQYKINSKLTFNSSAGYIVSKILNFNHITPAYNEDYSINEAETQITKLEQVDIAFAPRWNAYVELRYQPFKDFSVMLNTKAVGRQFIDNTQNDTRSIPAYSFSNLAFEHILRPKYIKEMKLNLLINNIFNTLTYTNAYTYNTGIMIMNDGSRIDPTHFNFVFPQAGINLMMGCSVMF